MSNTAHNHIFQSKDPKPPGECYSCDRIHALRGRSEVLELRNVIYGTLELLEESGSEDALYYLGEEASARKITRYENE